MSDKTNMKMLANIYDVIKVCFLSDKQNNDWAVMSRRFAADAKKELFKWGNNKDIEVSLSPGVPYIKIGRDFIIELRVKGV